jgi:nitroreductase
LDTQTAIRARRSVKRFDPAHRLTEDEIRQLLELVVLSPTSFNIQNWRFVVVTDSDQKRALQAAGWNQAQFGDCSLLVIICGDRNAYRQEPERYWANAPAQISGVLVPMIRKHYGAAPELRRDENLRSGSLAAQTLMLAAKAMGYDSCPMVGFDFAEVGRTINLPADHDIVMAVAVGKALEPARARGGQLPLDEVTFRDRFPGT